MKELLKKRDVILSAMEAIATKAESDILSKEDKEKFETLKTELEDVKSQIQVIKGFASVKSENVTEEPLLVADKVTAKNPVIPGGPEAKKEFESVAEFLGAVVFNSNDQRLEFRSEMKMGTGAKGGFAVPKELLSGLMEIREGEAFMRPGATVIPAGANPDAEVSMIALDQQSVDDEHRMFGGVSVDWIEEGEDKPETDANLREVSWKPKEVAAHTVLTDKLLRNWSGSAALIGELFRRAIVAAEDYQFIKGTGVGKPTGFIDHAATIGVERAVANQISMADIRAMEVAFRGMNGIWACSRSAFGYLLSLVGDGGGATNVFSIQQTTDGYSIYGKPLSVFERGFSALGTRGDLCLVDRSEYIIKDGSGLFVEASPHVHFKQNKTVIKAFKNVDGGPWIQRPYMTEDGEEVSPFVALDVPSGS